MNIQTINNNLAKQKNQILYIDILRVLSMLSVIFLHTASRSLRCNLGSTVWHTANILVSLMSTSVPIFFMISGALILNSKNTMSIKNIYKKRLPKILIPFLLWSIIAILSYSLLNYFFYGSVPWNDILNKLKNITSEPTTIHLWFMYVIIPLYLISPFLKTLIDNLSKNSTIYLVILWFLFSSVIPTITVFIPNNYQTLLKMNNSFNLNFMGGYLGFFVVGGILSKTNFTNLKKLFFLIIILDTSIIAIGSWWYSLKVNNYIPTFTEYTKIFTVILSISIFLFAKEFMNNKILSNTMSKIIKSLSSLSFGIYLAHNLIIGFAKNYINFTKSLPNLLCGYLLMILMTASCIIIIASIKPLCFIFTGLKYSSACEICNIQYFIKCIYKFISNKKVFKIKPLKNN